MQPDKTDPDVQDRAWGLYRQARADQVAGRSELVMPVGWFCDATWTRAVRRAQAEARAEALLATTRSRGW